MSRRLQFFGFAGTPVDHKGLQAAYGNLALQYKKAQIGAPPRKNNARFESVSRTKFLSRIKKPQKMWMKRSYDLMRELDSVIERGM